MKKAQIFGIGMVFITLSALIAVVLVVTKIETETSAWKSIGDRAFEIQKAYAQADIYASLISSAARWESANAVKELGIKGGHLSAECGTYKGINLWNSKDNPEKVCVPHAHENFYELMKANLDKYNAYDFLVSENRLLGIASKPLKIDIMAKLEAFTYHAPLDWTRFLWSTEYKADPAVSGMYVYRPNFEIPFNFDLDIYRNLASAAEKTAKQCSTDAKECARKIFAQEIKQKAVLDIDEEENVLVFTITQKQESIYLNNATPVIKFGLNIPKEPSVA